jgi:uncharacterized membrane protein
MVTTAARSSRELARGRGCPGGASNRINVAPAERVLSVVGGSLAVAYGLSRGSLGGLALAGLASGFICRGVTGHCAVYESLGINTARNHSRFAGVAAGTGVKVTRSITINRPAEDLYRAWRNFESLPRFMRHLVSVESHGDRSHWVARAPGGTTVSWDAEIINDEPNRLIAWRSLEGSTVDTAGSVHFTAAGPHRTEVEVTLKYDPPAGQLGSWVAWLFGEEPGVQIADDLARFKQQMESGAAAAAEPTYARR